MVRFTRNSSDEAITCPFTSPPFSRLFVVCKPETTLSLSFSDELLEVMKQKFNEFGTVEFIKPVKSKSSEDSYVISFVKYTKASSAALAIEHLNDTVVQFIDHTESLEDVLSKRVLAVLSSGNLKLPAVTDKASETAESSNDSNEPKLSDRSTNGDKSLAGTEPLHKDKSAEIEQQQHQATHDKTMKEENDKSMKEENDKFQSTTTSKEQAVQDKGLLVSDSDSDSHEDRKSPKMAVPVKVRLKVSMATPRGSRPPISSSRPEDNPPRSRLFCVIDKV